MRVLSQLAALAFAGLAAPAFACVAPWTPPPYAEALRRQVEHREASEKIALAKVVEARVSGGAALQLYDTIVTLNGAGTDEWAFFHPNACMPSPKVGELVLIYYDRVNITDPATGRILNIDYLPRDVVRVADNVDPELGPLLREAARRLRVNATRDRELAARMREITN